MNSSEGRGGGGLHRPMALLRTGETNRRTIDMLFLMKIQLDLLESKVLQGSYYVIKSHPATIVGRATDELQVSQSNAIPTLVPGVGEALISRLPGRSEAQALQIRHPVRD
jgi:hypothetical protein